MGILSSLVVPPQVKAVGAFLGGIPRAVWYALAATALLWLAYHHGRTTAFEDCHAAQAKAQQRANDIQVKAEKKRDAKVSAIATSSHQAAAKATAKTKEATDARRHQIEAAPVSGACTAPVGLPDLAPAVDAANAARGHAVPGGSYTRRQYRATAEGRPAADRSLGAGDVGLGERNPRHPDDGAPVPSG